ncbi:uncharacterized protein LOC133309575 isoform X2 [Gastrolobium bilobum]|nr:uncharacterized protein LOC133309575 isoform X2 [Gastrolobium bilobum]XP_061366371.1 uncharacterized protein LOC133309575 isoform X2 [Gastrolobium bilobum]
MARLYHIKCLCGMSDKAMTMILELLQDAFEHADIPSSFNEAKKTITKLGLDDEKIHACPNNCLLNWGADDEIRKTCKVCNKSRWKPKAKGDEIITSDDGNSKNKDICDKNAANRQKQTVSHTLRSGKKRELELLETQTDGISSTEDIYTEDFGEEHSGHDQSMGFDVCRSKVLKSTGGPTANEIKELKSEIDALSEQVAFLVQHLGVQLPLNQVTDLDSRCSSSSYASHEPRSQGPSSPPT